MAEARALAGVARREQALDSCWRARRLAKGEGLERIGEADLAIGLALIDLDRMNEGLEALYRAVRYFAQRGQIGLRGFAEALLAEAAWRRGEDALGERHLSVACDLLMTGADPQTASSSLDSHAHRLDEAERPLGASRMRTAARRLSVLAAAAAV